MLFHSGFSVIFYIFPTLTHEILDFDNSFLLDIAEMSLNLTWSNLVANKFKDVTIPPLGPNEYLSCIRIQIISYIHVESVLNFCFLLILSYFRCLCMFSNLVIFYQIFNHKIVFDTTWLILANINANVINVILGKGEVLKRIWKQT